MSISLLMSTTQFGPHGPKLFSSHSNSSPRHRLSLFHLSCLIHQVKLPRATNWETMGIASSKTFNLRKSDITVQLFPDAHMHKSSRARKDAAEGNSAIQLMLKMTPKSLTGCFRFYADCFVIRSFLSQTLKQQFE